ncbi:hypothetical protein HDK90DRAFT_342911 [Phyllosticta capitalensis]|uniref:Secreted protein n=1 Tax=Phyllosticta capitalensis TaxID=121624 RepID=A0ABR1YGB7_9PEZI
MYKSRAASHALFLVSQPLQTLWLQKVLDHHAHIRQTVSFGRPLVVDLLLPDKTRNWKIVVKWWRRTSLLCYVSEHNQNSDAAPERENHSGQVQRWQSTAQ